MFDNFPEELLDHVRNAYRTARGLAKLEDIQLLRMPYAEHLFRQFRNFSSNKGIDIVYHGTDAGVLDSIATYGMLDPTSPLYKIKNGNAYGPGIYVSPNSSFSIDYMRSSNKNSTGCLLIMLAVKGTRDVSADGGNDGRYTAIADGTTLNCDYYQPNRDIIVLRSTSQVLPIFSCKKITKNANRDSPIEDFTIEKCLADIAAMQSNISLNEDIVEACLSLQSGGNEDVKLGVIYNLFMKKISSSDRPITVIAAEVAQMLNDFDYTGI